MKQKTNYQEILRHENELTKLKIKAEFGVDINDTENLTPAVENMWLNNILEYERAALKNEKTTVGVLLGNPVFKKVADLTDDGVSEEIVKVMSLLQSKNIVIDSVAGIDDREMYRFITEELVNKETEADMPKNMLMCFIYEEYYPNHPHDIERQAKDFANDLENKEDEFMDHYLAGGKGEIKEIEMENIRRRITLFKDAFDEIRIEDFSIKKISVDKDAETAELIFTYKIATLPPGSKTNHYITGRGTLNFVNQFGWWAIEGIDMKGVI
jgi:hypothetical protein